MVSAPLLVFLAAGLAPGISGLYLRSRAPKASENWESISAEVDSLASDASELASLLQVIQQRDDPIVASEGEASQAVASQGASQIIAAAGTDGGDEAAETVGSGNNEETDIDSEVMSTGDANAFQAEEIPDKEVEEEKAMQAEALGLDADSAEPYTSNVHTVEANASEANSTQAAISAEATGSNQSTAAEATSTEATASSAEAAGSNATESNVAEAAAVAEEFAVMLPADAKDEDGFKAMTDAQKDLDVAVPGLAKKVVAQDSSWLLTLNNTLAYLS